MKDFFRRLRRGHDRRNGRVWRVSRHDVHVEMDRSDGLLEIVTVPFDRVSVRCRWKMFARRTQVQSLGEGQAVTVLLDRPQAAH